MVKTPRKVDSGEIVGLGKEFLINGLVAASYVCLYVLHHVYLCVRSLVCRFMSVSALYVYICASMNVPYKSSLLHIMQTFSTMHF